ncbi:DUF2752 domain-containing protein [Leptobacterium flavescens]|uniref:DUF2752 domain-containing protein n=1 Tax=Leptobacterium flavescens TaxID=472055 RepID=A0A6P0UQC8_9FLAO|nr:DUF2752 domain-containing protein [Leptobacterium flavescens]NER14188.1 DUF2752 domain-containing protein [Leptobacterium flavescens]
MLSLYYSHDPSQEESFFPKCPFYHITGYYCAGCGSQRALHDLLHLRFLDVIKQNLLFIPAVLVFVYHYSIVFMEKRTGNTYKNLLYHPRAPWVVLAVIGGFWILRNVDIYPFNLLAPN